jgi:hypothetical protein
MAMNISNENINAAGRFRTRGHTAERFISAAVYDHCYQAGSYKIGYGLIAIMNSYWKII